MVANIRWKSCHNLHWLSQLMEVFVGIQSNGAINRDSRPNKTSEHDACVVISALRQDPNQYMNTETGIQVHKQTTQLRVRDPNKENDCSVQLWKYSIKKNRLLTITLWMLVECSVHSQNEISIFYISHRKGRLFIYINLKNSFL